MNGMLSYFKEGLSGDKRPFALNDLLECNPCKQIFRIFPGAMQCMQLYQKIKSQLTEPIDAIFQQCTLFLKCLPRPILQLIGYPIFFHLLITYFINQFMNHLKNTDNGDSILNVHKYFIGFFWASYIITYFVSPGYFDTKEDQEEMHQAMLTKPELKNNERISCHDCNYPKVARSHHCIICRKCIAKYEYHSDVFNKCIGAGNHPYYYVFLLATSLLFGFQTYYLATERNSEGKKAGMFMFLVNIRICVYYFLLFCQHTANISHNLTYKEIFEARKLPYLWKSLKCEFFNPFDKGIQGNFREFFLVLTTRKSIPLDESSSSTSISTLGVNEEEKSGMIDTSKTNLGANSDSDDSDDEERKKYEQQQAMQQEEDEFDAIGKEKPVTDKYINWLSKKFYTIVDIPNCPIRDMAIQEMKKRMRMHKRRTMGDNRSMVNHQLRHDENMARSEGKNLEELEQKRKEYIERMKKDREEYMKKQLEIQKASFEQNPELRAQQKLYIEMGLTQARMDMVQNPSRKSLFQEDLKMAENNYIYLFGQEEFDNFMKMLDNPVMYAPAPQVQSAEQQQQQPQAQQQVRGGYQPEARSQNVQQQFGNAAGAM